MTLPEQAVEAVKATIHAHLGDGLHLSDHAAAGVIDTCARAVLSAALPHLVNAWRPTPLTIEMAVGGAYELPDGRKFWIDKQAALEITRRVLASLPPPPAEEQP